MKLLNSKYIHLLLIAISLAGASCQQKVTYELPAYENKPNVFCLLQPDSLPKLYLTEARSYYDYSDTTSLVHFITDAEVYVTDETGIRDTLALSKGIEFGYYFGGGPRDTTATQKGGSAVWIYIGKHTCKAGIKYSLEIKRKSKTITASTTIPLVPDVSKITVRKTIEQRRGGMADTTYNAFFVVKDNASEKNYYGNTSGNAAKFRGGPQNDPIIGTSGYNPDMNYYTFQSDDLANGTNIEIAAGSMSDDPFRPSDSLFINSALIVTNKETGDYFYSLLAQQNTRFDPFAEAVVLRNNITGGLGIFGALNYSKKYRIRLK